MGNRVEWIEGKGNGERVVRVDNLAKNGGRGQLRVEVGTGRFRREQTQGCIEGKRWKSERWKGWRVVDKLDR